MVVSEHQPQYTFTMGNGDRTPGHAKRSGATTRMHYDGGVEKRRERPAGTIPRPMRHESG